MGINVCSGGILGLGEKADDHVGLLHTVSTLPAHPESFPVNALVPIKGTPLGDKTEEGKRPIPFDAILRTIATARLVMPATIIRIAAGRTTMSEAEKMLTTEAVGWDDDKQMFHKYGLVPMKSFERGGLREGSWTAVKHAAMAEADAAKQPAAATSA